MFSLDIYLLLILVYISWWPLRPNKYFYASWISVSYFIYRCNYMGLAGRGLIFKPIYTWLFS